MDKNKIDIFAGMKLRARRTIFGMSQEEIGDKVGITFQQVQKYERGLNRIGASRMAEFCSILNVEPNYFFDLDNLTAPTETMLISNKQMMTNARTYLLMSKQDQLRIDKIIRVFR